MAFVATAMSPIMPISTFGIYAAICIILNYLMVITVTPSIVVVMHKGSCCYCCGRAAQEDWSEGGEGAMKMVIERNVAKEKKSKFQVCERPLSNTPQRATKKLISEQHKTLFKTRFRATQRGAKRRLFSLRFRTRLARSCNLAKS